MTNNSKENELLRRALVAWDRPASDKFSVIFEEIRAYLKDEEENSHLGKSSVDGPFDNADDLITSLRRPEPEAEPVAYLFDADSYCDHAPIKDELAQSLPKGMLRQKIKNVRPLYTRPEPQRKPMTREEIFQGVTHDTSDDFHAGYWAGIRWAEKHHNIGKD